MAQINYTPLGLKAIDRAETIRQPTSAILGIDSHDRNKATDSPYRFQITKTENIMSGFFTRLAVSEVYFPWLIPNVNRYTRRVEFVYDIGAGQVSYNVVLPQGFYTPADLANAIQADIVANTPLATFTMTYGTDANGATNPVFLYDTGNVAWDCAFNEVFISGQPPDSPTLYTLLGFGNLNILLNQKLDSQYNTNATFTKYIDIVCPELINNSSLRDTNTSNRPRQQLCRLYITNGETNQYVTDDTNYAPAGTVPFVIYKDYSVPKVIGWTPNQNIQGCLNFEVYDEQGISLNEYTSDIAYNENVGEWAMTILVSEN